MATNTKNFKFKKPDESDFYDVQDQNGNWDMADEELEKLNAPTFEDYSGGALLPEASSAIDGIKSGFSLPTLLSNIKAAFKGACLLGHIVNNCVTNRSDLPLSAAQGKALMDMLTKLNGDKQTSLKVKDISIKTSNYNFGNNMGGVITNIPCKSLIGDFEKILNAEIATWSACNTHTIIMLDSKGTYLTIWQAEKTSESELEIRFVYV